MSADVDVLEIEAAPAEPAQDEASAAEQGSDAPDDQSGALLNDAPAPTEYDATARQRISAELQTELGALSVKLIYEPTAHGQSFDALLREYAKRVNAIPATDSPDDEAEARALTRLDAAGWLFDTVIKDVEGIGAEGEDKPANWKEYFTPQEKIRIVEDAILSATLGPDVSAKGARVSWSALAVSTLRLRVLFDEHSLDTRHTLKKADTSVLRDFAAVLEKMQAGGNVFFPLAAIYGRLKVSARGYAGGIVPVHHQAFAVYLHLNTQLRVTRKN